MRAPITANLYRLLEVDPEASPEVIAAAYRTIAKRLHPDVASGDTTRRMAEVNAAYDVLRDTHTRTAYDRDRAALAQKTEKARDPLMGYGKHRGQPISTVPTDYLLWVVRNLEAEGAIFDATQELVRRGMKI